MIGRCAVRLAFSGLRLGVGMAALALTAATLVSVAAVALFEQAIRPDE